MLDDAAQSLPELKLDQQQADHLASLVQGIQGALDHTNALLEKFESLGVKSSSLKAMRQTTWNKVTWDEESIRDLRSRIISNTTILNAFISSLARQAYLFREKKWDSISTAESSLIAKRLSQQMTR